MYKQKLVNWEWLRNRLPERYKNDFEVWLSYNRQEVGNVSVTYDGNYTIVVTEFPGTQVPVVGVAKRNPEYDPPNRSRGEKIAVNRLVKRLIQ